ncbi:MAG: hypothetical protein ACFFD4_09260 [Candidatus Odinarchaeota archaeon]
MEQVQCRDEYAVEKRENLVTDAGTFDCCAIKIKEYEDGIYTGYTLIWVNDNGTTVQEMSYDDRGMLVSSIKLSTGQESGSTDTKRTYGWLFPVIITSMIDMAAVRKKKW